MKMLNKISRYLQYKLNKKFTLILNINCNLFDKNQKRILLCYLTSSFSVDLNKSLYHPNIPRCNQMVTSLIKLGYAVDICDSRDMESCPFLKSRTYEAVLGFGPVFEFMSNQSNIPYKIIYVTENDPTVVMRKFKDRLSYFKLRHPKMKVVLNNQRETFYSLRQFELASHAIIMTNDYNSKNIKQLVPQYFKIKVNGFVNPKYSFSNLNIASRRKHFLWFGSTGMYQKGLDILIDVFALLPEYTLNIYGVNTKEIHSIRKLLSHNVLVHSKVSVQSDDFIRVLNENLFIISASCLEGMQSGVATCMRHGLIPLLTKECGYDEHPSIVQFDDYKVETIKDKIIEIQKKSDGELAKMSYNAFEYGNADFTLEKFVETFEKAIQIIIK